MSLFGDFEHHLQISVVNYIPNTWVMFNWDIYQPLLFTIINLVIFCSRWSSRQMPGQCLAPSYDEAGEDLADAMARLHVP